MKKYVAIIMLALFVSGCATIGQATEKMVLRNGQDYISLENAPCDTPEVQAQMDKFQTDKAIRNEAKRGLYSYNGKTLKLCWIARNGQIHVIDAEGDTGSVPIAGFKKELGM